MRRLASLALSLLFGLILVSDLCAQVVSPPRGGVATQAQGGGGGGYTGPWTEWSVPYPSTYDQYPLLRFYWCDNSSLAPETRWVKVNGVDQTSSFDYTTEDPSGSCVARASSQSTTVALNLGDNLIEMYICDEDDLGPYCWYGMQYVTRLVAPPQAAPIVTLRNFNGDNQDRSLCLTVGAGQAAGLACGDLFVVHGMPAYRTMGRDRSLTLFYSSHQAAPRPTVAVWVSQPSGTQTPTSVFAKLMVNGVPRDSATYSAWGSANGPRQIVLAYDASGDPSGLYPFTLEVRNQYAGGPHSTTVTDTLMVINRSGSEFGAGWWLAGVERLVANQPGNKILWLGGDGSAAVYRLASSNHWVRAAGAFRDTLVLASNVYTRTLRHGVQVVFGSNGRHIRTVNRTGQITRFTWSDTLLTGIRVPPGDSGPSYTLAYYQNKLDYISDPAGRVLNATVSGGNLTSLLDPDNIGVSFGYDAARRMTSRTGRGGYSTTYWYGAVNPLRVDSVRVPLNATETATTAFEWWDEKGLAIGSPSGPQSAADTTLSRTKVDGPRTDVADTASFRVDRWGAPVRIVGAVNDTTILTRSATTGLVAMVRNPVHDSVTATYTDRGNLQSITDHTFEGTGSMTASTTTYVYADAYNPDSPTQVRSPVDTMRFHYDADLGLPDTVVSQGGARGALGYISSGAYRGLLQTVTEYGVRVVDTAAWTRSLQNLVTSIGHDVLGNDSLVSTPSGAYAHALRDQAGRAYRTFDPAGHRTEMTYDSLNRLLTVQAFDSTGSFTTTMSYTTSGLLWRVRDPRQVNRQVEFDAADRPVAMTDEAGATEHRVFNRAGQVESVQSRTGQTITMRYDAGGRLRATVYPPMANQFTNSAFNRTLAGDSIVRTYDAAGRLLSVARGRDTVLFEWNREGTIRSERQIVRNNVGLMSDFTVRYWTDLGGRRTKMYNGTDTLRYSYGADGRLATLAVQWGTPGLAADTFRFVWDSLGRRDSLIYVGPNAHVSYGYDRDGSLRMVCSRHPGNPYSSDYLEHALVFGSVTPDGLPTSWTEAAGGNLPGSSCSPFSLPNVLESATGVVHDARHQVVRDQTYDYSYDASGNRLGRRFRYGGTLMDSLTYAASRNRLSTLVAGSPPQTAVTFTYNASGALRETSDGQLYYYNAIGETLGYGSDSARFHYDPLGRRVYANETGAWLGFDAENTIRNKGGFAQPLWRYVHGPGLDDPLVGAYQMAANQYFKHYYVTDGGGRLLAFTDATGNSNEMTELTYVQNGGAAAGPIRRSRTFENQRMEVAGAPGLSFYRNRYHDQRTGRWTQEDPIGPAGGVNLYAYAGNNPVAYTDPFGLLVRPHGRWAIEMVQAYLDGSPTFARIYQIMDSQPENVLLYDIWGMSREQVSFWSSNVSSYGYSRCHFSHCFSYVSYEGPSDAFVNEFLHAAGGATSVHNMGRGGGAGTGVPGMCDSDNGYRMSGSECLRLQRDILDEMESSKKKAAT